MPFYLFLFALCEIKIDRQIQVDKCTWFYLIIQTGSYNGGKERFCLSKQPKLLSIGLLKELKIWCVFFWLFLPWKFVDIEKHNLPEIFSLFVFLVYHQDGKRMFLLKIKHTRGIYVTLPIASFKWPTDPRGFWRKNILLS